MTLITTQQLEMLTATAGSIDAAFADVAGILRQRDLDPVAKKKLTKIIGMLQRCSSLIGDLTEVEEPEGKPAKASKKTAVKPKAKAARSHVAHVKRGRHR
jgi:hypothetical protein